MKIKKSVDLDRSGRCITRLFRRKLLETCDGGSDRYNNNMQTFGEMLQELADEAFKLGQEDREKMDESIAKYSPPKSVNIEDVVLAVAKYVESQEGGPFDPKVIGAAIRGQLQYGDAFKTIDNVIKFSDNEHS